MAAVLPATAAAFVVKVKRVAIAASLAISTVTSRRGVRAMDETQE